MDEIAARLQELIADPRPALDRDVPGHQRSAVSGVGVDGNAFISAIESPMFFTANTIDQPGKQIALAAHGHWLGGDVDFHEADSWLLVGTNPLVPRPSASPDRTRRESGAAIARG